MQTTSVLVTLGGGTSMTIPKHGVTVAEFMVLAAGHGLEHVNEIAGAERGEINVKHALEYARLSQVYSVEDVAKCFGPVAAVAKMPTRFSDIGIGADEEDPEPEPVKAPAPVKAAPVVADKPAAPEAAELKLDGKTGK